MKYFIASKGTHACRVEGETYWTITLSIDTSYWSPAHHNWRTFAGDYRIPTLFLLLRGLPE